MNNFTIIVLISIFRSYLKVKIFFKKCFSWLKSLQYIKEIKDLSFILKRVNTPLRPSYLKPFLLSDNGDNNQLPWFIESEDLIPDHKVYIRN